jgi:hypothetical protein
MRRATKTHAVVALTFTVLVAILFSSEWGNGSSPHVANAGSLTAPLSIKASRARSRASLEASEAPTSPSPRPIRVQAPCRYSELPAAEVFAATVPSHIPHSLVSLEWVEVVELAGEQFSLRRCRTSDLPFDLLYNASRPGVFLVNLDSRKDRLAEAVALWSHRVQLIRVRAQRHAQPGGVAMNGCALSHVSIILAMKVGQGAEESRGNGGRGRCVHCACLRCSGGGGIRA